MLVAHIKPGKERAFERRHPWVYPGAIAQVRGLAGPPQPGETIQVVDDKGKFLAWGAYNEASQLPIRVWSFDAKAVINEAFIAQRVRDAVVRRQHLRSRSTALRLIFGEADGLPGLVVDQYDQQLVMQCLSGGAEYWRDAAAKALQQVCGTTQIYERSDAAARQREGLPSREGVISGEEPPAQIAVQEDGIAYGIDVRLGHKTGFYIDQRDSRLILAQTTAHLVAATAASDQPDPISVLNCFCYTAGFSLAALKGGASKVVSVDSSGEALAQGQRNLARNPGFGDPSSAAANLRTLEWRDENVFDYLKNAQKQGEKFDIVVLDPPKFAPSAKHLDKASRAYKELNIKGLQLLKPGGYLFTFSCSGAVSVDLFQKIVAGAVFDAHVDAQLQRRLAAGDDHPMAMTHPEGEYLKGLLLRRM
jgi:23S rRNA (cytosine1962-C5)-methyltransferase